MQTVFESDLGVVEVACPWCHYPLNAQLIVSEQQTSEMYYKLKTAYERILFLQHYDAARIFELTKLQFSPIIKRRTASPSVSCHEIIVDDDAESIEDCVCSSSCNGTLENEKEDESHCPI